MQVTPLILTTTVLLGAAAMGYGKPAQAADKHLPSNATAMKAGAQRHTHLVAIKAWRKTTGELPAATGATDTIPMPDKYVRTGMLTGLKPEQEAEYRSLHATAGPGGDVSGSKLGLTLPRVGFQLTHE